MWRLPAGISATPGRTARVDPPVPLVQYEEAKLNPPLPRQPCQPRQADKQKKKRPAKRQQAQQRRVRRHQEPSSSPTASEEDSDQTDVPLAWECSLEDAQVNGFAVLEVEYDNGHRGISLVKVGMN